MLFKKLIRTALKYKAQFISMIIMIALGIGVFLGFNIEWYSLKKDTNSFLKETNFADYRLYLDSGFTQDDIKKIENIDGVSKATRYLSVNVSLKGTDKTISLNVSEDYTVSTMFNIKGIDYDETQEGIWLSDRFAEENGYKLNDLITLTYNGIDISGEIVGLIKSGENMICVADTNQLMPDFNKFGFAYISKNKYEEEFGYSYYPQINLISNNSKASLEEEIKEVLKKTVLVIDKQNHISYSGVTSEVEEGKTMGSILPVLFLVIAILTMTTTMHRIVVNEKTQIGTLKALGFRNKKILLHYTSYGLVIGIVGTLLGIALGYLIGWFIISPQGMMSTYIDMPDWSLYMPWFCIPILILTNFLLTFICFLSIKNMLKGTAADTLRAYTPKKIKKSILEKTYIWKKFNFGTKWNIRDILRHKSRSLMTLIGVIGCMILLVGGLGMCDTMTSFMQTLDKDINNYKTKVEIIDSASNEEVKQFIEAVDGDYFSNVGVSCNGETISLEIYGIKNEKVRFVDKNNKIITLSDDGVYLCQRLKSIAKIGDDIVISPYGSDEEYSVKVKEYFRSLISECMVMSANYAEKIGLKYQISTVYTDFDSESIINSPLVSKTQDKKTIMDTYDKFMELMDMMVLILILGAVLLGIVVLYNLGVMSYIERGRELATLKVLGFKNKSIAKILISQNIWLTILGIILGIPCGGLTVYLIVTKLASEYEMKVTIGLLTYLVSIVLTFTVSVLVGVLVARKNRKIDMVEALKCAE